MNINNNLEKYNVLFFCKLCKWHSVLQQDLEQHHESPQTVFNFKQCYSTECTNQTVSCNIHKIKNNTDIRACSFCQSDAHTSFVTTATAEYSFRIILGPIQLILK